ncbi:thiamine phosphate synthase [Paraburkholderia sp. IW21]|uniref:thiamine phosphate synthase n=1 Tax=Paraburkholderia sp. IW21 TaxID=3242488 RepID=UPI003521A8FD
MINSHFPEHYLITPETERAKFNDFIANLAKALLSGIRLVQLRVKTVDDETYAELATQALHLCHSHHARLILNGPNAATASVAADGIHLSSARLMACTARPIASPMLVSAACHSLEELMHAERIGVDIVTLSPVLATASHPEAKPMGWESFEKLTARVNVPVYALGGMTRRQTMLAQSHGAQGIAAIRGLW